MAEEEEEVDGEGRERKRTHRERDDEVLFVALRTCGGRVGGGRRGCRVCCACDLLRGEKREESGKSKRGGGRKGKGRDEQPMSCIACICVPSLGSTDYPVSASCVREKRARKKTHDGNERARMLRYLVGIALLEDVHELGTLFLRCA